jgi:hypothetical protein
LLAIIVMVDPKTYRDESQRLRRKAETSIDPGLQRVMIEIAEFYERMAETLATGAKPTNH